MHSPQKLHPHSRENLLQGERLALHRDSFCQPLREVGWPSICTSVLVKSEGEKQSSYNSTHIQNPEKGCRRACWQGRDRDANTEKTLWTWQGKEKAGQREWHQQTHLATCKTLTGRSTGHPAQGPWQDARVFTKRCSSSYHLSVVSLSSSLFLSLSLHHLTDDGTEIQKGDTVCPNHTALRQR